MRKQDTLWLIVVVGMVALMVLAVQYMRQTRIDAPPSDPQADQPITRPSATISAAVTTPSPAVDPATAALMEPDKEKMVMETKHGRIVIEFFPKAAPNHVKQFKKLASEKFYDGARFHRVIPGFMVQFGDPLSKDVNRKDEWGTGGDEVPRLKAEFNSIHHEPGIVAAARTNDPNSASCQFYIVVGPQAAHLDNQYTVFGRVVQGQEVADAISKVERDSNDRPLQDEVVSKVYLTK